MSRKYRGKYPNAARTVSAKGNDCTVITNAGAVLKFHGVNGAAELGFNIPKLGQDMSEHLAAHGIATRAELEQRAELERAELIRTGARRFAVGDPARYECGNETARVEVRELSHGGGNYVRFADGSEVPALSRNLFPAARFLISPQRVAAVGAARANWKASAHEVLAMLRVTKLPRDPMPVRFIQGHAVYVIGAQEARDVGEFHRVRVICDDCGEHVPAGRMHQHKCRSN